MSPTSPSNAVHRARALVIVGAPVGRQTSTGGEMRRSRIIAAVSGVMPVDVFVAQSASGDALAEMATVFGVRTGGLSSNPPKPRRARRLLTTLLHPGLPSRIARKDRRRIAEEFLRFADSYDVTVVERIEDYLLLKSELTGHVIVDLDDLESDLVGQVRRLKLGGAQPPSPILTSEAFWRPWATLKQLSQQPRVSLSLALDERRWKGIERATAATVGHVLVCNEQDRTKLGSPANAVMARNGFERSGPPVGRLEVQDPPTVGFWGSIGYQPNADAAAFLVTEILPHLQVLIPNVRVLIVGRGADRLTFADQPAVTVEGFVETMASALQRIDVAVVPLRMGAGTRIKILEAWSHRIPVVSTSIGAYGLVGVGTPGLIVADTASGLANALKDALTDTALRGRLIDDGWARVHSLSWATMDATLAELVSSVCEGRPASDEPRSIKLNR